MTDSTPTVLIIDDEPDIRELLEITLMRMGISTETAENVEQALKILASNRFNLCLTDMKLPDGNGLEIVRHIQQNLPELPVAVITAFGSMDIAVEALKAGAFDFVSKPVELDRLRSLVQTAFKLESAISEQIKSDTVDLVGNTPAIEHLRSQIIKLGRSQAPVFINGESGSGKELVARLIHANSPRASGPFVPVNCGAIPSELMESEFFGHKKGSFTGAGEDKKGLFQASNGGTLFLDEVADLPLGMQVKLLRAIQEKAVRPIGAHEEVNIDVRILSATHKNLENEIQAQRFRSDLYYRINVIELRVPPLRERQDDIPTLTKLILKKLSLSDTSNQATISSAACKALYHYPFPGNVRELENILERAFTLCENNLIDAADLHLRTPEPNTATHTASSNNHEQAAKTTNDSGLYPKINPEEAFGSMEEYLENIEKDILITALEREKWNKTAAAKLLGISFRTLRYRLKKFELD
jgi:two-component system response regulator PilR (NtrC family)